LSIYSDPNIPTTLLGDPTKLSQVLINLISNAIKFTPNGGTIYITMKLTAKTKRSATIYFSVKDTGIGISEEEKDKIFDAFSQADASTSRKYGGTGLGLSISSQLIKYMGGVLDIRSRKGVGSNFFFSLKFKQIKDSSENRYLNLSNYKIGYISDDIDSAKNLKIYIEYQRAEFRVYTIKDILSIPKDELPHLLLIDYSSLKRDIDIESFLKFNLKIVLIVENDMEKELRVLKNRVDKLLYKPINLTRTLRALEILKKSKNIVKPKPQNKIEFKNIKALVAEDNFINQKLMKKILDNFGIDVTIVNNGEEALKFRRLKDYDIIFMDIQMPIMGGIQATREIFNFEVKENKKHIPIIALTANAQKGDKERYINEGMDDYISKPMKIDELKDVLEKYISHKVGSL
jgi:CheY-like chemotaxis protein